MQGKCQMVGVIKTYVIYLIIIYKMLRIRNKQIT